MPKFQSADQIKRSNDVGVAGIEPTTFRSRTERSTDELHPV